MKKILILIFCLFAAKAVIASDSLAFKVHVIDYSLSWTSSMHYYFDDEFLVEEVDNIDKNDKKILAHRQLLGKEMDVIKQYLELFMTIGLNDEYVARVPGERNQKRISISLGDKTKSVFVSNTYQRDIAGLISFLNMMIPESRKMKEFTDPTKPTKK